MNDDSDTWVALLVGGMALLVGGIALSAWTNVGRFVPYGLFALALALSVAAVAKAESETT